MIRLAVVIAAVSMALVGIALFKASRSRREYAARPYRSLAADGLPVTRAADTSAVVAWRLPDGWPQPGIWTESSH